MRANTIGARNTLHSDARANVIASSANSLPPIRRGTNAIAASPHLPVLI
ncbi:MAG: hypothetical protein AB1861_24315 [Cyanobacteriota bacterium]